jgi:O-methyltransferase
MKQRAKQLIKRAFKVAGLKVSLYKKQKLNNSSPINSKSKYNIPEEELYLPTYSPWSKNAKNEFAELMKLATPYSLVSADRCFIIYSLAMQSLHLGGMVYECGVYKGGTAIILANILSKYRIYSCQKLYLFDTFEGMPDTNEMYDLHNKGDFSDTSFHVVKKRVGLTSLVEFNKGFIPETFIGKEEHSICFAHIDVDIYKSVLDCCEFIYPRLLKGGIAIFDDYGFASCPGAKKAVDDFFKDKIEIPLVLPTGQAIIFKI